MKKREKIPIKKIYYFIKKQIYCNSGSINRNLSVKAARDKKTIDIY